MWYNGVHYTTPLCPVIAVNTVLTDPQDLVKGTLGLQIKPYIPSSGILTHGSVK